MSTEAGEAEEQCEVERSTTNITPDMEVDTVWAIYSQQAKFEQGSPSAGDSAADRAKLFLAKKRDEIIENIRRILIDKISTYDAIRNQNTRSMAVPNLIGGLD